MAPDADGENLEAQTAAKPASRTPGTPASGKGASMKAEPRSGPKHKAAAKPKATPGAPGKDRNVVVVQGGGGGDKPRRDKPGALDHLDESLNV
ncbi:hypothetical protein DNK56_23570 [Streptomyces sp. AC1-42W]|nr:hypothetical protein DNK56_23570 [Streptomyces sp. AC1-42W]